MSTPLAERMKLHKPGQITWPEPELKEECISCRHYYKGDTAHVDKGRCDLVRKHDARAIGSAFFGATATACSMFSPGVCDRKDEL